MSSVRDLLRTLIGNLADGTGDVYLRMGLGIGGAKLQVLNTTEPTGQAFSPLPRALNTVVEGIAQGLGASQYADTLQNAEGSQITAGNLVYVSTNLGFRLATDSSSGILGVVGETIEDGATGLVVTSGLAYVKLAGSPEFTPGALIYASATPGRFTNSGATPLGIVLDLSSFGASGTVLVLLRIPAL